MGLTLAATVPPTRSVTVMRRKAGLMVTNRLKYREAGLERIRCTVASPAGSNQVCSMDLILRRTASEDRG